MTRSLIDVYQFNNFVNLGSTSEILSVIGKNSNILCKSLSGIITDFMLNYKRLTKKLV